MKRTVVLNVVGLTKRLIGEHTPFLSGWVLKQNLSVIKPILPALTCSVQSTYLTGKLPDQHGIVGNGWYFRDECEIKFWKQSNKLVQSKKIWETAKEKDPAFTCANLFWWYNMYSSADYSVTPRPQYHADGIKIPDIYTNPPELREKLQRELGIFPLFDFWGPKTSIRSSEWIAESAKFTEEHYHPTLTLIYLPHLDYALQRHGNDLSIIKKDLNEIDATCKDLVQFYETNNCEVVILSEYGITNVNNPVHINRILRANNLLSLRIENSLEILDAGASKAFAVADHQVAHVYINDKSQLSTVKKILENAPGIEMILGDEEKKKYCLNHERSADLICIADKNSWFTYYYWLEESRAPDFARTVDIHRKPGYDPAELFLNPKINFPAMKVGGKVLRKKLGFRYLMDVIPLDASLVKGSHGRIPESKDDWPVMINSKKHQETIEPTEVFDVMLEKIFSPA